MLLQVTWRSWSNSFHLVLLDNIVKISKKRAKKVSGNCQSRQIWKERQLDRTLATCTAPWSRPCKLAEPTVSEHKILIFLVWVQIANPKRASPQYFRVITPNQTHEEQKSSTSTNGCEQLQASRSICFLPIREEFYLKVPTECHFSHVNLPTVCNKGKNPPSANTI